MGKAKYFIEKILRMKSIFVTIDVKYLTRYDLGKTNFRKTFVPTLMCHRFERKVERQKCWSLRTSQVGSKLKSNPTIKCQSIYWFKYSKQWRIIQVIVTADVLKQKSDENPTWNLKWKKAEKNL